MPAAAVRGTPGRGQGARCRDCQQGDAAPGDELCARCRLEGAKDQRRRALRRLTIRALITMCETGVTAPGGRTVQITGGQHPLSTWSKDDLVAAIMLTLFPDQAAS